MNFKAVKFQIEKHPDAEEFNLRAIMQSGLSNEKKAELRLLAERNSVCFKVAKSIGSVSPALVGKVIGLADKNRIIFQGIRNYSSIAGVEAKGVENRTPEGGNISSWNAAQSLFYPVDNSTFFNWAHSYAPEIKDSRFMALALASYELLVSAGIPVSDYSPSSELAVGAVVPRSLIFLVIVQVDCPSAKFKQNARLVSQFAEKALLSGIYDAVRGKFVPGGILVIRKKYKE